MLAARLAEAGRTCILINRTPAFGLGVAYSTPFEGHLLNVRSNRMSAVSGDPDHFVRWLQRHRPDVGDPEGFAPRKVYGDYVRDRLAEATTTHPGLIEQRIGGVVGAERTAQGWTVRLADGETIEVSAVVIATGNPAPRTAGRGALIGPVIGDPWAPRALERIGPDADIVIVGTGLTMVDMLLSLDAAGWTGRAAALSRRGLLPRAHGVKPDAPLAPTNDLTDAPLSRRLNAARQLGGRDWKPMMEGLRPVTARLWEAMPNDQRARFVRHLRPWWDVHRHRIAPQVADVIGRLMEEGRLSIRAGRLAGVDADRDSAQVRYRPRGGGPEQRLDAAFVIDCTGPGYDPGGDPLTAGLIAAGHARVDPLKLGLEADGSGRLIGRDGAASDDLFLLGPPARAAFWETIAVPDIRERVEGVVAGVADRSSGRYEA